MSTVPTGITRAPSRGEKIVESDTSNKPGGPVTHTVNPDGWTLEKVFTWAMSLIGTSAGIIFGVWAILSYDAALASNKQSALANQLALLGYCSSANIQDPDLQLACRSLTDSISFRALASAVIPSLTLPPPATPTPTSTQAGSGTVGNAPPTSTPSPGSPPTSGPTHLGLGAIVGIIVGVVSFVGLVGACCVTCLWRPRRKPTATSGTW